MRPLQPRLFPASLLTFVLQNYSRAIHVQRVIPEASHKKFVALLDIHHSMMHQHVMADKELIAATSTSLVLLILSEADSYGYEIIQRVHAVTQNEFKWTDSMLYPVLHRLEKRGLVKSYWQPSPTGRKRKYYSVSQSGLANLEEKLRQWKVANNALISLSELASN